MRIVEVFQLMMEDRIAYVVKNFSEKIKQALKTDDSARRFITDLGVTEITPENIKDVVTLLKSADPDENPNSANLDWIVTQYTKNQFKLEDIELLRDNLDFFFKNKNQLNQSNLSNNLFSYKTVGDLYTALQPLKQAGQATIDFKTFVNNLLKDGGYKLLVKKPNIVIYELTEFKCSQNLAKLTNWCTTQAKNFPSYTAQGPLYVIAALNSQGKPELFQFHYETSEYKNHANVDINAQEIAFLSKFPEYTNFLNFLIKKHYGKYFTDEDAAPEQLKENKRLRKLKISSR